MRRHRDEGHAEEGEEGDHEHGGQQHQALDDLLVVDADAHDGHAVVHHAHDEGADHRTVHLAHAARGRGAADEAGGDDVEFKALSGFRLGRIQARGINEAGKRSKVIQPRSQAGVLPYLLA